MKFESGTLPEPLGRRIGVDLNDDAEIGFVGQRQQLLERVESVATVLGLPRLIHPRLDAVESERLDCRQIAAPGLSFGRRVPGHHRRARGAAAVPHTDRNERRGGLRRAAARRDRHRDERRAKATRIDTFCKGNGKRSTQ